MTFSFLQNQEVGWHSPFYVLNIFVYVFYHVVYEHDILLNGIVWFYQHLLDLFIILAVVDVIFMECFSL